MDIKKVVDAFAKIEEGIRGLQRGPTSYYLECMTMAHDLLVNQYAPFLKGDRVELAKTPDIGDGSGWRDVKHCLVEGAKATVTHVEVQRQGLCFYLMFDNETRIPHGKTEPVPIDVKGKYPFTVDYLRKTSTEKGESYHLFGNFP